VATAIAVVAECEVAFERQMRPRPDRIRVLHVDDERDFAEMTSAFLTQEDERFDVVTATSVERGLALVDDPDEVVDCVVSDYDMPGTNGIEFLQAVRDRHPELPFVLFTAKGSEEIASRAISAGVTDYLQKGQGVDRYTILANRIQNAVHRYESDRELARYRQIVETVDEGVYVLDDDLRFVFVNGAMADLTGRSREELVGTPLSSLVDAGTTPVSRESLAASDDRVETVEARLRTPGADPVHGEFRFSVFPSDDGGYTVGTVRDVTAQREHATALERVRDRMEFALDATDSVIYEVDLATGRQTRHGPFERLYGFPSREVPTTESFYRRAIHPDDRDDIVHARETFRTASADRVEYEYRTHPDAGPDRWIRSEAYVHAGPSGAPERLVGLATDITRLKRREHELERRNERLDEFVSVASHDIRNPLNVAVSALDLAREECESDRLDTVADAHDRMRTLVEDLLRLARDQRRGVDTVPVSVADLAERCWRDLETGGSRLVVESDQVILADETRTYHLLENLLANAVGHGSPSEEHPSGCRSRAVLDSPGDRLSPTVTVDSLADGFVVEDDGPGIDAADRDRVFEHGYSTAAAGTGIGLSIVADVAETHGWDVAVRDGADGGARFEVRGVEMAE
jgi:PAS domain S-box-containing protein